MNRQTIGQRLDLNMLRFQQAAMIPENYQPKTAGHIPGPVKPSKVKLKPTAPRDVLNTGRADKMAASARRRHLRQFDRLRQVTALYSVFDKVLVAKVFNVSEAGGRAAIKSWEELGLVEQAPSKTRLSRWKAKRENAHR